MKTVSAAIFREIFNNDFNLTFKKAHSDTCKSCDSFKSLLSNPDLPVEERLEIVALKRKYDDLGKKIADDFMDNVGNANDDNVVLTIDLQKVFATPSPQTSITFYKRQLSTYNLCTSTIRLKRQVRI